MGVGDVINIGDIFWMLMPDAIDKVDIGVENGQNRHQDLKVVANTFRLQHPSPTSM